MSTFYKKHAGRVWQFVKLSLLSGFIFLLVLSISLSVLAWLYRDHIKEHFIARLNQGLQTEIFIENISVNVFRSFPFVSISLSDVRVMEMPPLNADTPKDTLLAARKVYFQFNVIDFFRKNYHITRAEVEEGSLKMKRYVDGSNNYTFWQSSDKETDHGSDLAFSLQKVTFSQIDLQWLDDQKNTRVFLRLNRTSLAGNFSHQTYMMKLTGDLHIEEVVLDNSFVMGKKNLRFDFGTEVLQNQIFRLDQGRFILGSHQLRAAGLLDFSHPDALWDIQIEGAGIHLENLIKDLPPQYARYFEGYRSKGTVHFNATIAGAYGAAARPSVNATFGIENGELYHRSAQMRFSGISFTGTFSNGSQQNFSTSQLTINDFYAFLNHAEISGQGTATNLLKPRLDVQLYSNIKAADWAEFLKIQSLGHVSGDMLVDIEFKGQLGENRTFTTTQFLASQVKGVVRVNDLNFSWKDSPVEYRNIDADFLFNNNDVIVNRFSGYASDSDFDMKGYFRNVLPWLFLEQERLFVDASLVSERLNFNELLQHSVSESDTIHRLRLSDEIDFHLRSDVKQLNFKRFEARDLKGSLLMRDQIFHAENVSMATMKGHVQASGFINGQNEDFLLVGFDTQLSQVDVHDLFFQMGNFGQTGIGHENLQGRITATASFASRWSPFLEIDWSTLETSADIKVEDGVLLNYKPMLALSRFIRVGDLQEVKFSTLENQIRIKDQKIIIPDMEINSSAINIKLSGEHFFDNRIHYRLQVLLSDLLARRNRESRNPQEQYGDIIDDGLGRTTLFLLVTGTLDEPVFRYDHRGVREKLREDFRQERENLRQVFRTEFGLHQPDTLPDGTPAEPTQRQIEQKEIKEREKGRFILEWDN